MRINNVKFSPEFKGNPTQDKELISKVSSILVTTLATTLGSATFLDQIKNKILTEDTFESTTNPQKQTENKTESKTEDIQRWKEDIRGYLCEYQ